MSPDRRIRWTATSALAVSCFALGFSVWSVSCQGRSPTGARHEQPGALHAAATRTQAAAEHVAAPAVTPAGAVHADVAPAEPADPAPHADAPSASDPSAAGLEVKRLVVTRGVKRREPLDTDQFTAGAGPVFAFVELGNTSDTDKVITLDFQHNGEAPVGHIKLKVPAHSSRWRTWGRTRRVDKGGDWTALVRAADGTELAHTAFDVQAPQS